MGNDINEPITVGLSANNHEMLETFKQEKIFQEMMDGYRFAIAYSLYKGIEPPSLSGVKRETAFNIGSLDPKKEIYNSIIALNPPNLEPPIYKYAERLAEWGMTELVSIYNKNGTLDLAEIIQNSHKE
jgi:hypothetical protein